MKLQFYLRFHTEYGQSIWITGNKDELGNYDREKAILLKYLDKEFWTGSIDIRRKNLQNDISYRYLLKNQDGELLEEWGRDRRVSEFGKDTQEVHLVDTWNHAGEYENVFYSDAFNNVLLRNNKKSPKAEPDEDFTHVFKVKAPLLKKNEAICLLGNCARMRNWSESKPVLLGKEDNWWTVKLDLSDCSFPLAYKYGVYNLKEKKFLRYEGENNRLLSSEATKKKITILHDGFAYLPNNTWKGAGVAIPVFSLRSKKSFGVGEFADIRLLVDWAGKTGLKLIQLLPINDTMSNFDWTDSYPYSAISAFALHPLYINLAKVAGDEFGEIVKSFEPNRIKLNELPVVDYEEVIKQKYSALNDLYEQMCENCFKSDNYKRFFDQNKHWLEPYAAFCYFRDKYKTSDYTEWKTDTIYSREEVEKIVAAESPDHKKIGFYYFTQFHLHQQLEEAVDYAHKKGVVLKGDIPIGISRTSCDAWVNPEMFNMNWQAGAPPDDFTAVGQNWSFPTYNWEKMQENGFAWWKQRFEQMSNYFDAFRIDHILGFFRIWSIPIDAVQGILGRFVPCLPVHINEFGEKGIWFDYQRYCRPYITDDVLKEVFSELAGIAKEKFLVPNNFGGYDLELQFETQRQVEEYFKTLKESDLSGNPEENDRIRSGLFELITNVILFDEEESQGEEFHFRISLEKTSSFRHLDPATQAKLKDLYIDYFFHRQDDFWYKEAMHKLPPLKEATNMLVCGEDLGMVPHCVPDVMKKLGILSLEIQRMPKDPKKEFFHPNDAPYMSVITPSTHDMSTLRGWWEENRERTQLFYNEVMGQWGDAPQYCEAWINRAIVFQHLYSPAMWSIFQLQDILGMSETLRREKPQEERINDPANPRHYWQYRMHITLEDLVQEKEFNEELREYVEHSGRG